jgi:hypothetical protein
MDSSQEWKNVMELLREMIATNHAIKDTLATLKAEVHDLERRVEDAIGRRLPPR